MTGVGKLFLLLLVTSLAAVPVLAQHGRGRGPDGHRGGPDPAMHLERILGTLNLTADQQTAIDKIVASHRTAGESGRDTFMAAHKALAEQIHLETFDEQAVRQAAAAVAALQADRAVDQAKALGEIRAVLTADQRTQLKQSFKTVGAMMEPPPGM